MLIQQRRRHSLLETCVSTAIGAGVSLLAQLAIFPALGIHVAFHTNLVVMAWFTAISIARGYAVRRAFNWWHARDAYLQVAR